MIAGVETVPINRRKNLPVRTRCVMPKARLVSAAIFGLAFLLACSSARADVVEINRAGPTCIPEFSECTLLANIRGEITEATVDQLKGLIGRTKRAAEEKKFSFTLFAVELDSPGGSIKAAIAIGRILRSEDAGAWVNPGARCLSSCVLILAGGTTRGLEGKIGIHRPYFPVPSGDVSSEKIREAYQRTLQEIRGYLREMNVIDGLADAMLRISPENIRILNHESLANFGITQIDPIFAETFDLHRAKSLGVDRQEYMRRKLLAEEECGGPGSMGSACYRNILKEGRIREPIDFSRYGEPVQ